MRGMVRIVLLCGLLSESMGGVASADARLVSDGIGDTSRPAGDVVDFLVGYDSNRLWMTWTTAEYDSVVAHGSAAQLRVETSGDRTEDFLIVSKNDIVTVSQFGGGITCNDGQVSFAEPSHRVTVSVRSACIGAPGRAGVALFLGSYPGGGGGDFAPECCNFVQVSMTQVAPEPTPTPPSALPTPAPLPTPGPAPVPAPVPTDTLRPVAPARASWVPARSSLGLDLDSRFHTEVFGVRVTFRGRQYGIGTLRTDERGNGRLVVPRQHIAKMRRGAYITVYHGRTAVGVVRLR